MAEDEDPKLTVPKFSSFKGKQPAPAASSGSDVKPRSDDKHRSGSRRDSERRKHARSHHHESSRRGASEDGRRKLGAQEPENHEAKPSGSDLYVIDTKGDHLIRRYGGIDRAQIPRYYRHGAGRVLGTRGRLVIHQDGARDKFSLRFPGEGLYDTDGLRSKSLRFMRDPVKLRPRSVKLSEEATEDFLPVGRQRKKRKRENSDSASSDEDANYRSIEGKAKVKHGIDSDDEGDSESSAPAVDVDSDNPLKWKSIQLNRKVKENPGDIDAWIELVDHQDTLLRAGETIDERHSDNAAHSFSEIKVSMLESALASSSAKEGREKVLVLLMREGMKIWPSKIAAKKWTDLAEDEMDNFELWRAHLDFAMTSISTFQYDDIRTMLLKRLHGVIRRSNLQHREDWEEAIYVLLRATQFIKDAGYQELALAVWQSILEIHFFKPDQVHTREEILESFGVFWESEGPRIGDDGAKGWRHHATGDDTGVPAPNEVDSVEKPSTRDVYKAWSHTESTQAQRAWIAARTMDEGTEDDPFRVVMFSDLESWLFRLPAASLENGGVQQLIDAFLIFCQLPLAFRSSPWTELAFTDQFTTYSNPYLNPHLKAEGASGEEDKRPPAFDVRMLCAAQSPDLMFSGLSWFRYFSSMAQRTPAETARAANTVQQLVLLADLPALAVYSLGLSYAADKSTAKKRAKQLLKKFSDLPSLYHAYALAEYASNGMTAATKILRAAIESTSLRRGIAGVLFHMSWSWMELEAGQKQQAAVRLLITIDDTIRNIFTDTQSVSSTMVLKARQSFTSGLQQSLYEGRDRDASVYAEALTLLSYLVDAKAIEPMSSTQGNISAAIGTITDLVGEFTARGYSKSLGHESLVQFGAKLLYFNACHGPFRRVFMSSELSSFLDWFPRNTILLSLLEWADSSLKVVDETRQLLYDKVLIKGRDCVSSRVFSIEHEARKGNANSAQAAFEHALSTDVCQVSVPVWVSYIRYCYSQSRLRSKAKDVFYRALRNCPWSKDIMMEAFITLIREMKSEELRAIYDTMSSKGLRIHQDLDDFLEMWKKTKR